MNCERCIHRRICDAWSRAEGQDASCYLADCFEEAPKALQEEEILTINILPYLSVE